MSELPDGWALSDIGTVCQYIQRGKSPKYDKEKQTYPIINQKCIRWNEIQSQYLKFVTPEFWEGIDDIRFLQKGDILWNSTGTGTIGRASLFKGLLNYPKTIVDSHITVLRPHLGVDSKYLHCWIQSSAIQNKIEDMQSGTTNQVELSKGAIQVAPVYIAPEDEQRRIAKKLDKLLEAVNSANVRLDKIPVILKNFRSSILVHAISGQLTQDWRDKNKIKLESWEDKSGCDVFPYITSGSRGWAKYYSKEGATFLRVGNLNHQTINLDLNSLQHVTLPQDVEGKRTRIKLGDILISITADVGMVALIDSNIGEAYINQHLCLARQSGEYNGKYLGYYLASPIGGLVQLTNKQRGVTKAGITLGDIREVFIKIPCLEEQQEIVDRVEKFLKIADQIEKKYNIAIEQIDKITQSVLAKAFRGELVLQNSNDEPASVLLKRIEVERTEIEKRKKETKKIVRKRKSGENKKMIIPVIEALMNYNIALSTQELFVAAGYPNNASIELIEDFFMDIRQTLENPKIECQRIKTEDFFKIVG